MKRRTSALRLVEILRGQAVQPPGALLTGAGGGLLSAVLAQLLACRPCHELRRGIEATGADRSSVVPIWPKALIPADTA